MGAVVILCDTREARPLHFPLNAILTEVRREKLQIGDYQALYTNGHRSQVVFERKSLPDLFGTFTRHYPRFKKRVVEARDRAISLHLAIEGTLTDVLAGLPRSSQSGDELVQRLFTVQHRYGLRLVFCASRAEMSRYIVETFEAVGRDLGR